MLDWAREAEPFLGEFDCVVQTGSWGRPVTDLPVYQVFWAGWQEQANDLQTDALWFYTDPPAF